MPIEMPIPGLGGGYAVVVDDTDVQIVSGLHWFAVRRGRNLIYAMANTKTADGRATCVYMHRLIRPDIPLIDHADRNGLNNRRYNLRPSNYSTNGANTKKRAHNLGRFKGVRLKKDHANNLRPFEARIGVSGKTLHIGYFASDREAAEAYNERALIEFGEFANLNNLSDDEQRLPYAD